MKCLYVEVDHDPETVSTLKTVMRDKRGFIKFYKFYYYHYSRKLESDMICYHIDNLKEILKEVSDDGKR